MTTSHHSQKKNSRQLARKQAALERAIADLESISPLFKNKKFKELMDKVAFSSNTSKEEFMEEAFSGKLDELTLQLLMLVSKIYDLYQSSQKDSSAEADIVIRTAIPLSEAQEKDFVEKIRKKRGAEVKVRFEYDPHLIGGVQVYERDSFIDLSLKNSLQKLEKQLK